MEEFLNGRVCVRLTEDDIPLLAEFQRQAGINWASGDSIDSNLTRRYIEDHQNKLVVKVSNSFSLRRSLFVTDEFDVDHYVGDLIVSLSHILSTDNDFAIEEDDILNLIK